MCSDTEKIKLIVISGPTATGKTALGVRLAKDLNGEIISADSMQVYRGLDIGTAKVTPEETEGIPHYMIDVADPRKYYSIAEFKNAAKEHLYDITSRGKVPIVVGGTGFYIHALLYDTDFGEEDTNGAVRLRLQKDLERLGPEVLHERLREIDPESAEVIHPNNTKRVVRALEFHELTGMRISEHNRREKEKSSPYDFLYFALRRDREQLNRAIDERVDRMVAAGLFEEVARLKASGIGEECISMQGIGYKEETAEEIKNNSRHYAKRQMTWLKREENITWVDAPVSEDEYQWILKKCMNLLESANRS